MKRLSLITLAVATYWLIRLMSSPAVEAIPASIDDLQMSEVQTQSLEQMQQADRGVLPASGGVVEDVLVDGE